MKNKTITHSSTSVHEQRQPLLSLRDIKRLSLSPEERKDIRAFVIDYMEQNPIEELREEREEEVKE